MATSGYIDSITGGLPDAVRLAFRRVGDFLLNNLRFGHADTGVRATNFQLYVLSGTTASVANTEFSLAHGLGSTPYLLLPCLNLSQVNEQLIPLQVSRAADATRIYLKSSSTSAAFRVWVETP